MAIPVMSPLRQLSPLCRGRAVFEGAWRTAPIACRSPGRASFPKEEGSPTRRVSTITAGSSITCSRTGSRYTSPCSTGICRHASGRLADPRHGLCVCRLCGIHAGQLSDRVHNFMTVNELRCFTDLGHLLGVHAPGLQLPPAQVNQVRHHGVLAHGLGVQAIRAHAKPGTQVGLPTTRPFTSR